MFYWNRAVIPWKFTLEQALGAEAVTMSGLLGVLGIVPVVNPPVNPLATGADETVSLAAQVAQLRQLVEGLVRPGGPTQDVSEAGRVAAAALQGARQGGSDNPSNIFNLSGNNNTAVGSANMNIPPSQQQVGSNADAELVKALAAAGVPPTQIAQILQSRVAPAQPMEHRNAWFQVAEGTSPLCYTLECTARRGSRPRPRRFMFRLSRRLPPTSCPSSSQSGPLPSLNRWPFISFAISGKTGSARWLS